MSHATIQSWPRVQSYAVDVCDDCINLKPSECHTPGCRFFLMGIEEIKETLSRLLIRCDFEDAPTYFAEPIRSEEQP